MEKYTTGKEYVAGIIKDAEDEYARRLKEAAATVQIGNTLPDSVKVRRIHASNLYGSVGSVWIGGGHGHDAKRYSWSELCDVIRAMPPIPAKIHRGGGTSITPGDWVDSRYPDADEDPIHGLWFTAESPSYTGPKYEAHWYAKLDGGIVVRVSVELAHDASPVFDVVTFRTDKRTGERVEVTSKSVRFADWWASKYFRYGGGSIKDPGSVVAYNPREWQAEDLTGDELAEVLLALRS